LVGDIKGIHTVFHKLGEFLDKIKPWISKNNYGKVITEFIGEQFNKLSAHNAPGFRAGNFSNINDVSLGQGINVVIGTDALASPGSKTGFWESFATNAENIGLGVLDASLGANTFTVGKSWSLINEVLTTIKNAHFEGWETAATFLAGLMEQNTTWFGAHLLAGGTGGDTYAFEGPWGAALILELPDFQVGGVNLKPEAFDTLDFSGYGGDLEIHIEKLAIGDFSLGNIVRVTSPGFNFHPIGLNFGLTLPGGALLALDIENIRTSSGKTTVYFHDGAELQGFLTPAAGGELILDYSNWTDESKPLVADLSAGLEIPLGDGLAIPAEWPIIGGIGFPDANWHWGSASGVAGNRLGSLGEWIGLIFGGNIPGSQGVWDPNSWAVRNVTKIIGTPGADTFTGSGLDNVFECGEGNDIIYFTTDIWGNYWGKDFVNGGAGDDTLDFSQIPETERAKIKAVKYEGDNTWHVTFPANAASSTASVVAKNVENIKGVDNQSTDSGNYMGEQLLGSTSEESVSTAGQLSQALITTVAAEAEARWNASALMEDKPFDFSAVRYIITDLPGRVLAQTGVDFIFLDATAAGAGWFVDATPAEDFEFGLPSLQGSVAAGIDSDAYGRYDLLTVIMHELGHVIGLSDIDSPGSLMNVELSTGLRKTIPEGLDWADAGTVLSGATVDAAEPLDKDTLLSGLNGFASWAADFNPIDTLVPDIPGLPFIDESLDDFWNVTGTQVTARIEAAVHDEIASVFANDTSVTTEDLLALDVLSATDSGSLKEFKATLNLAEASKSVDLSFDSSSFLGDLGFLLPAGVTQSEPIELSTGLELEFVFGLDGGGEFYVEDPLVTGRLSMGHENPFGLALNIGPVGIGIDDGTFALDLALELGAEGHYSVTDLDTLTLDDPVLDSRSYYDFNLPIKLLGALAGFNMEPALISGTFNTPAKPAPIAGDLTLTQFFALMPTAIKAENFTQLLEIKSVSLDALLEGFKAMLQQLVKDDGVAYKKLPIIDQRLVDLLGGESGNVIESLIAAIDTVQDNLSDIQRLEIDLNQAIESALDLGLNIGGDEVDAAYADLTAVDFDLNAYSTDAEIALAMARAFHGEDFNRLLIDREVVSAFDRLAQAGLDSDATNEEIALKLADAGLLIDRIADRDRLKGDDDYLDASDLIAGLGLDALATDDDIAVALDNTREIEAAKAFRDLLDIRNQADYLDKARELFGLPDEMADEDVEKLLTDAESTARDYLARRGIAENATDTDISDALGNQTAVDEAVAARDYLSNASQAVKDAAARLTQLGLTGRSSDYSIAVALGGAAAGDAFRADRDYLTLMAADATESADRLTAKGLEKDSTDLDIALALIDPSLFAVRKQDRDILAVYEENKILGLAYRDSRLDVDVVIDIDLHKTFPFQLDLQELISNSGAPEIIQGLIGDGGIFNVTGGGDVTIDAFARFDLGFGFDLADILDPQFFAHDSTGFTCGLEVYNETPLNFAGIINVPAPLDLQVKLAARDAAARLSLGGRIGLADDNAGDGQYLITELIDLGWDVLDLAIYGDAALDLPLYFPTETTPFGGSVHDRDGNGFGDNVLHVDTGFDSQGGFEGFNVVLPNLKNMFDLFALLNDPQNIIDGLDLVFDGMDGVSGYFSNLDLPLIGDAMKEAPGFVEELRHLVLGELEDPTAPFDPVDDPNTPGDDTNLYKYGLGKVLGEGVVAGRNTIEIIREELFKAMGDMLVTETVDSVTGQSIFTPLISTAALRDLNLRLKSTHAAIKDAAREELEAKADQIELVLGSDFIQFNLMIKGTAFQTDLALDKGVELPDLGLTIESNAILDIRLDYLFAFGFGFSVDEGLYLDTSGTSTGEEISLELSVTFKGPGGAPATLTGDMAAMALELVDLTNSPEDVDGRPSGLFGSLEIDLQGGTDGRLALDADFLSNFALEIRLQADVDLDFEAAVTVGDSGDIAGFSTLFHYQQNLASIIWNSKQGASVSLLGDFDVLLEDTVIQIAGFAELSGDLTLQKQGSKILLGANDVEAFLGVDGTGVQVTGGEFGAVFGDGAFAMVAYGTVGLKGLDPLTASGTIGMRINTTGGPVNETIFFGGVNPGQVTIDLAADMQLFEAGYDRQGNPAPGSELNLAFGDVANVAGRVRFTLEPSGRIQAAIDDAQITLKLPDADGNFPQDPIFSIKGRATFYIGGEEGFKLKNWHIGTLQLLGKSITLPGLSPSAALAAPLHDSEVDLSDLNTRKSIDVVFNDPAGAGLTGIDGDEFVLSGAGIGTGANMVTLSGPPTPVSGNIHRYTFTGDFTAGDVRVEFKPGTWSAGTSNVDGLERFTVTGATAAPGEGPAPTIPTAKLANPESGASVDPIIINAGRFIDVTFIAAGKRTIDRKTIDGDEFTLTGPGLADADLAQDGTPKNADVRHLHGSTYRFTLQDKDPTNETGVFTGGAVTVNFNAGAWQDDLGTANTAFSETFTVAGAGAGGAKAAGDAGMGPVTLKNPTFGLADFSFKDMQLSASVSIGAELAALNFGKSAGQQSQSGIRAEVKGVLGTFAFQVDVNKLLTLQPAEMVKAFSLPGQFSLSVASLEIEVPKVVVAGAKGIKIQYDPAYDPADNNGAGQELVVIQTAGVSFPLLKVSGSIKPYKADAATTIPGLVVRTDGFALGTAELCYGCGDGSLSGTNEDAAIKIGSLLEFDDIRIGVSNFGVTFGQALTFNGRIYIASGGAKFLPGLPVSAVIEDRLTAEPGDVSGIPDTEAMRVELTFTNGKVDDLIFSVDTFSVRLGSFLSLTGQDVLLNTGAEADEEVISFASIGADLRIGSLVIGGEARHFAFMGDGTFKTKAGFGVFLSAGAATGGSVGWPSWIPIKINEIGLEWEDINNNPADFILTLSAGVTGIDGIPVLECSGAIEGIKIDPGLLFEGKFPILEIKAMGVSVTGEVFGGRLDAGLVGGIIKLDADGNEIGALDSGTEVADRVFFMGVQGGFGLPGVGGLTIRFALSELGPLGVHLSASVPGGILLEPTTGLSMNDLSAGVEFFKSLPAIDDPALLREPAFDVPTAVSADTWLTDVRQQVVQQYQAIQSGVIPAGFLAAFTSPMLITGSAKIYSMYTSEFVFNGRVLISLSTDGKLLIGGKLNFAADAISLSAKLYVDLSRVSSGDATVLFLSDVPDQVRVLTAYGKLQMGFKDAAGNPVEFDVVLPDSATPLTDLAGPRNDDTVGAEDINSRGYLDLVYTVPAGATLDAASITDLAPEFLLPNDSELSLDDTQAPLHLGGNTFRYWTRGRLPDDTTTVTLTYLKETWAYTADDGRVIFNPDGAYEDENGDMQTEDDPATAAGPDVVADVFARSTIDVKFFPATGATLDTAAVGSITDVTDHEFTLLYRDPNDPRGPPPATITPMAGVAPTRLGDTNTFRYYFDHFFAAGEYEAVIAAGSWMDSNGTPNPGDSETFAVVTPMADVAGPFSGAAMDVAVANAAEDNGAKYIDVIFFPTPGSDLDYAAILGGSDGAELTLTAGIRPGSAGTAVAVANNPVPIEMAFDDDYLLQAKKIDKLAGESEADFFARLAREGITRFRYAVTEPNFEFPTGEVAVDFIAGSWQDTGGNPGTAQSEKFLLEGPTADLAGPFDGGDVDLSEINQRNYIDVAFHPPPAGYELDVDSVTDLAPEFILGGPGAGSVRLDDAQAPVLVDPAGDIFRYWVTGSYLGGDVTLDFLAGTWSYVDPAGPYAVEYLGDLSSSGTDYLDIAFPVPADFEIDTRSVNDSEPEFTLGGPGLGDVTIDDSEAPLPVGDGITLRYRVDGTFAAGDVTVTFDPGTWSVADLRDIAALNLGDLSATSDRTYLDVNYAATRGSDLDDASISDTAQTDSVLGDEFTLGGAGVGSAVLAAGLAPTRLPETDTYRYYIDGRFGTGQVTVTFAAGAFADNNPYANLAQTQTFTVQGPTADLAGPANGESVGTAVINGRGHIDVVFRPTGGNLLDVGSILDTDDTGATAGDEFTLDGSGLGTAALDSTRAPEQLPGTNTFRYYLTGTFVPGVVRVNFNPGSWADNTGTVNLAETEAFSVTVLAADLADPLDGSVVDAEAINQRGYIDVEYQVPAYASVLDLESIIDPEPEFTLATAGGSLDLDETQAPVLMAADEVNGRYTFRYWTRGDYTSGDVTLSFIDGSWSAKDLAGDGIDNFAQRTLTVEEDNGAFFIDVWYGGGLPPWIPPALTATSSR